MTLREAIQVVLKENRRPLSAKIIASIINTKGYYIRSDRELLQSSQVLARIKHYPAVFQNINGHIVLIEDENWKNLLTSYLYIVNSLKGIYIIPDIQFIVAVLFLYKRLVDINDQPGRRYPLLFGDTVGESSNETINNAKIFIENLKSLEKYYIAPEGIFEECSRLLSKLDNHKKLEIWSVIRLIRTQELSDNDFGNIFEYFITLDTFDSYKSSINFTPYSLRELMVSILDVEFGKTIYDPVSGTGGLLIESYRQLNNKNLHAKGSEINKRMAQLGNMNLIMHGIKNVEIESNDCFEEINNSLKFDFIIGDLPANGTTTSWEHSMLYNKYNIEAPRSGKSFGSLVLLVLDKLNDSGKSVLTVSDGFLVKKGKEKEIRDLLIRQDVIECIISLPYGTLRPYTEAKASLLILNKNKPRHLINKIQFIKAKAIDQDSRSLNLNNEDIIRAYKSEDVFSKDSQIIEITDLQPDTNLSADAYDAQYMLANLMLKEGSAMLLSDLAEIRSGIQPEKIDIDKDGDIPLIKIENLSRDILDISLIKEIYNKVHSNSKYLRSTIAQDCILIARIGDSLKPTIYRYSSVMPQIIPHNNVYILIPVSTINIEYLYYQLHTSFVLEQIEKRRLGSIMPYISISGLKEIVIPFMKLDSQISFVESQKANLIADERKRIEDRIKALGYKEEVEQTESDIVRTLVHQLRPTLLNIDLEVKKIKRIIAFNKVENLLEAIPIIEKEEDDLELSEHINEVQNYTLIDIVDKLRLDTLRLSEVLTTVNKVMSFKLSPGDFENVELLSFFKEYLSLKEIDIAGKFKIEISGEKFYAEINKTSFKELIDQLLLNAEKHGFVELKTPALKKILQFNIRRNKERQVAIIEYQNNGEIFNLEQEDFIKPFHKSQKSQGSGIGGNYIYRIIQAHGGIMNLKFGGKISFAINFEIPLKQSKEYE